MPVTTPDNFTDFTITTVAGGAGGVGTPLNAADVTVYLPAGFLTAHYPSNYPYMVLLGSNTSPALGEICKVTATPGANQLTLLRNQGGTNQAWPVGSPIQLVASSVSFNDIWNQIQNLQINVKAAPFNAVGNGVTDDTTAITSAITAAATSGGFVYFPAGTYIVSSTINIGNGTPASPSTINGVVLLGSSMYSTSIKWNGSSGGEIVHINGICSGNSLRDITLDGNSGLAATGLELTSAQYARFDNLRIINCSHYGLKTGTNASGSGTENTIGNTFGKLVIVQALGTISQQCYGISLDGVSGVADTNQNSFENTTVFAQANYCTPIRLGFCDYNDFGLFMCFVTGTGTHGIELDGTVSANFPVNNRFANANFAAAPFVHGTPGNNWVDHYDTIDASLTVPTGTGLVGFADNPGNSGLYVPFGPGAPVNQSASPAINMQITTTSATNVVSVGTPVDGLYLASLYIRQTNAAAVTVTALAFTGDETGTQDYNFYSQKEPNGAYTILNAAALAQASYTCVPIVLRYANAAVEQPVIQITCGTANVVYVTASIIKIG